MFTNTRGPFDKRCVGAVTAMMELWEACFFVLILDFTFGKEIASNSIYVIRKIETCPDVGYFFKRELSPNLVDSGPCFLCFCRDNGTATCWERERRRCDVERYHHHRVGRQSRYRRSFSDVFFRDATRDFFGKNLPQQCKPYESSFSDGCPPADWCIGCTICDCDSNGQWDCHILSFCDGKESKKKVKFPKNNRRKNSRKSLDYDNSIEVRPTKRVPIRKTSKKTTIKPKPTKPSKKNYRKVVKAKPGNKTNTRQSKKANKAPRNPKLQQKASKKNTRQAQTKAMSKKYPKSNVSRVKIIKKVLATRKPVKLNKNAVKGLKLNPNSSDTIKLGQKIVNQVMTTFKKMLAKEIDKFNETKRTRLLDGKDCGGVKKRDKRTYNVRSKAVARNKNKYNRQGIHKENYTTTRMKREILNQEPANVNKISVITLPTDVNAVIPLVTSKEENSSTTNSLANVTSLPLFTLNHHNYYEYTIKNDSNWSSTTLSARNTTERKENEMENNFVIPVDNKYMFDITSNRDKKIISPNYNDQKITKWYVNKKKNDERKKQVTRLLLPKPNTTKSLEFGKRTDKNVYIMKKSQNTKSDPNHDVIKKYNLTTLVSRIYRKPCCKNAQKNTNRTDIMGLKNIIQNLFIELNKTNTAKRKRKPKGSVFKYVRKFFHKIFTKTRSGSNKVYGLGPKEDHTLQILCENIGSCKIKRNSRIILKYKLKQLNKETKMVLKSIKTVKGLLHLLELPESDKNSYVTNNNSFKNDIQKLGAVIKDYKDYEMNSSLTFTQKTQIDYIKNNTQTFIEAVKKFADILADIIALVKPNDEYDRLPEPSLKRHTYTASLNKIKKMLYQYNIMQNTFMRRMYELINGEEEKTTTTEIIHILESDRKQNINDNVSEKYSKNIIENLRKLKTIVQVLSIKRKKRELTMGDDALDYILTLMEMLIRQNHPLDTVPANDGIDLLIDAIKNAPDIKLITGKNFDYERHNHLSQVNTSDQQTSDSNYDSKRISNEENTTDSDDNIIIQENASSKPSETLTIQAIDDDVTQKVYYRIFNQENNNEYDATTEFNRNTNKRSNNEDERTGFDKFESYLGDPKKLEVETAYVEEDAIGDVTTDNLPATMNNTDITDRTVEEHTEFKRTPKRTTAYIARNNETSFESQDSMNDKRSKLEWIEEAFDREIRMINSSSNSTPPTRTSTHPTPFLTKKKLENNSDLTKEDHTEESVKKSAKNTKPHDVMYQKHLQFLNSLDYGTERSADFEESEPKEDARSDDVFPAYFV